MSNIVTTTPSAPTGSNTTTPDTAVVQLQYQ